MASERHQGANLSEGFCALGPSLAFMTSQLDTEKLAGEPSNNAQSYLSTPAAQHTWDFNKGFTQIRVRNQDFSQEMFRSENGEIIHIRKEQNPF